MSTCTVDYRGTKAKREVDGKEKVRNTGAGRIVKRAERDVASKWKDIVLDGVVCARESSLKR